MAGQHAYCHTAIFSALISYAIPSHHGSRFDLAASLQFYCNALGLQELKRYDNDQGRFTLVFLSAPNDEAAQVELTYNWDPEPYAGGRNWSPRLCRGRYLCHLRAIGRARGHH